MRRAAGLLAMVLGACATPPDRLEETGLSEVPRTAALAAEAEAPSPPAIVPPAQAEEAQRVLAAARARGSAALGDCFRLAELANEDLLSGDEDRLQAALRRDVAIAGILPTFALSAFAVVQDRVPDTSGSSAFSSARDREQWALTVRQPIFKGFAEFSAIRVAARTRESRLAAIEALRASLRRAVARAFFGALQAKADLRTLQDSERLDRARFDEMRARLDNGLARRSEVLLQESQLLRTQADLQRASTSLELTRATLAQLVGVELGVPLADDGVPAGDAPPRREAVAEALRSRAELRAARLTSEAAEATVDVIRSGYWPSVSVSGNWYLGKRNVTPFSEATDWDATLNFDFPFFEGGGTDARVRIAKSDLRKARLVESAAVGDVVADVEAALARAAAGDDLLATFERTAQIARENVDLLREEYAHGIATNLEVLTARNDLQSALRDLERQRLANRLDLVDLALAIGRTEIDR